jgi:hypothetical protein
VKPPARREHVVLLGDSIFDNGAYIGPDPDVTSHLRAALPREWTVTLCAVDGARALQLIEQLRRVTAEATQLVVAVGGNDALGHIDLLSLTATSSAEVLDTFGARLATFEADYRRAIRQLVSLGRPATVCTIYEGALPADEARLARIGLMMFNDVILRTAFAERFDVIELRAICHEASDYANQIEPSGKGGYKIARAIARSLGIGERTAPPSRVWAHY